MKLGEEFMTGLIQEMMDRNSPEQEEIIQKLIENLDNDKDKKSEDWWYKAAHIPNLHEFIAAIIKGGASIK